MSDQPDLFGNGATAVTQKKKSKELPPASGGADGGGLPPHFAPLSGEVLESNPELRSKPELVNSEPYGKGWMLRLRVAEPKQLEELLDPAAYDALTAEG